MPKPTVTVNLKRLEADGLLRREIDAADLRRHRLVLTPDGRKAMTRGLALLSGALWARLGRLRARHPAVVPQCARASRRRGPPCSSSSAALSFDPGSSTGCVRHHAADPGSTG